jgi:tRNA modification GTPase
MRIEDTISAIATPIGEGGLAIVRISGREALTVAGRIFRKGTGDKATQISPECLECHRAYFGQLMDKEEPIDQCMLTVFRTPRSFTREDTIELTCHGGHAAAARILTVTLQNGCRTADPGEFTKRAFLNGRIDLTQAEAVSELIRANSELARAAAVRQLQGSLKNKITKLRGDLLRCIAELEAAIDFSEEDLTQQSLDSVQDTITSITASLQELRISGESSRILRDGIRTVIVGIPNSGKSTLLNALLNRERAIVSSIPGTTRDTIEELVSFEGIPFRLIDTAGLREAHEEIEKQGVERTMRAAEQADLLIIVLEVGRELVDSELALIENTGSRRCVVAMNKIDLSSGTQSRIPILSVPIVPISAKTGEGIPALRTMLLELANQGRNPVSGSEFLVNCRHQDAISRSHLLLSSANNYLKARHGIEVIASDVRLAANALGEIIGETTTEDILDSIFSSFCIGK